MQTGEKKKRCRKIIVAGKPVFSLRKRWEAKFALDGNGQKNWHAVADPPNRLYHSLSNSVDVELTENESLKNVAQSFGPA
jgi:hypothetical protein